MITPAQIKAARALLGWGQKQLAYECRLSAPTMSNIELGKYTLPKNLDIVRWKLEDNGIEFIDGGVRLHGL